MSTNQYAFAGTGTFSTIQGFDSINFLDASAAIFYDMTGALELLVDVAVFNKYIGIVKDANYLSLTSSNFYDNVRDVLLTSNLTLTSTDVFNDLSNNLSSIENVGKLRSLYSDFDVYTSAYFGLPSATPTGTNTGFATLFNGAYDFDLSGGVFGPSQLLNMITPNTTNKQTLGAFVTGLTGSVSLGNITSILRSAVSKNTFNNRNTYYGTTASSPNDRANYGVTDGFMDGDLLFIPNNGFQTTLNLNITTSPYSNINGVAQGLSTQILQDASFNIPTKNSYDTSGNVLTSGVPAYSEITTATSSLITRIVQVPLLIRLVNLQLPYIVRSSVSTLNPTPITTTSIAFEFRGAMDSVDISRFVLSTDGSGNYFVGPSTVLLSGYAISSINNATPTLLTSSLHTNGNLWYQYADTGLVTGTTYVYTVTPHLSTLAVTTGYAYTYQYVTM